MQAVVEMQLSVGDGIGECKIRPIPNVFRRVEFRRVGGEEFWMDSRMFVKERFNGMMTVDCSAIPQQNDRSSQVPVEVEQEEFDIPMLEAARAELHVKSSVPSLWRDADSAKGGDSVLFEPMVEVRCLASGCPSAPHIGDEQKAAFIHEYEMGAKSCGFVLCEAIRSVSSAQSLLRPFGAPDARVFDSSIPVVPRAATSDSDDIECETVSK